MDRGGEREEAKEETVHLEGRNSVIERVRGEGAPGVTSPIKDQQKSAACKGKAFNHKTQRLY